MSGTNIKEKIKASSEKVGYTVVMKNYSIEWLGYAIEITRSADGEKVFLTGDSMVYFLDKYDVSFNRDELCDTMF